MTSVDPARACMTTDDNPVEPDSMLSVDAAPPSATTDHNPAKPYKRSSGKRKNKDSIHKGISPYLIPEDNEFYDAGILYSEEDFNDVDQLMTFLRNHIVFQNGAKLKIDLFDIISPNQSQFAQIQGLLDKCSCIILYLTPNYLENCALIHHSFEILINTIKKDIHSRDWNLMLLVNEDLEVPLGMSSLSITKLHKYPKLALRKLQMTLQDAQNRRKQKKTGNSSLPPPVGNTYIFNVNSTNVQIGNNPKMYGVCPDSPDSEDGGTSEDEDEDEHQQIELVQPNLLQAEGNIVSNISGPNVQIPIFLRTPVQEEPDSTSDSPQ